MWSQESKRRALAYLCCCVLPLWGCARAQIPPPTAPAPPEAASPAPAPDPAPAPPSAGPTSPAPTEPLHPASIPSPIPDVSPQASSTQEQEKESVLERSDLRSSLSNWIAEHQDADFEEVARTANRLLRKVGYPMALDAVPLLGPQQDSVRLKAGDKVFVFHAGQELSARAELCGERFLRIPARPLGDNRAALISGGRAYPFSLEPFRREQFRVLDGKKVVGTFFAPEPTEPIGISGNGHAIFLRFPLDEDLTAEWWARIARQQPAVLDEDPYLVLRVSKRRLYFDENLEHLPPQEFEVEESKSSLFRWKFQPSGLVLELSSQCG